jgi:hypothetical protein
VSAPDKEEEVIISLMQWKLKLAQRVVNECVFAKQDS